MKFILSFFLFLLCFHAQAQDTMAFYQAGSDLRPKGWFGHGDKDMIVPLQQSELLKQKWKL